MSSVSKESNAQSHLHSGTGGLRRLASVCATYRRGTATGLERCARSSLTAVEEDRCGDGSHRQHEDALSMIVRVVRMRLGEEGSWAGGVRLACQR